MKRNCLLVLVFMTVVTSVVSATASEEGHKRHFDHLTPEFSMIGDPETSNWWVGGGYHRLVTQVLAPAYDEKVWARVVVLPSFWKENAIGIREQDGSFEIFFVQPNVKIWNFANLFALEDNHYKTYDEDGNLVNKEEAVKLRSKLPEKIEDIELEQYAIPIASELAQELFNLFSEMLYRTKYAKDHFSGRDGITYHFSLGGGMAGQTWSPHSETKVGRLVGITKLMERAAVTNDQNYVEQIRLKTTRLLHDLEDEPECQRD